MIYFLVVGVMEHSDHRLKAGYHRHWLSMVNSGLALHHFTDLHRVSPSLQVSFLDIQSKREIALLQNLKLQCPFVFQS